MVSPKLKFVKESSTNNNSENNANKEVEIEIFTDGYQGLCQIDSILDEMLCMFASKEELDQDNKGKTR